jgi:hypothetical protein
MGGKISVTSSSTHLIRDAGLSTWHQFIDVSAFLRMRCALFFIQKSKRDSLSNLQGILNDIHTKFKAGGGKR